MDGAQAEDRTPKSTTISTFLGNVSGAEPSLPLAIYGSDVLNTPRNDLLQGTLVLLVLKTLAGGREHGYGITLYIQRASRSALRVEEGSLYPALHRMEQEGWLRAEWAVSENNRRARYYELTAKGRTQLVREEKSWNQLTQAVASVLQFV